jgi:hypothetical protein
MLRNLKTTPTREGYMTKNILEDTIDKFYNLGKSPNNVMLLKYIVQNAKRSQYLASLTKIMGWLDYGDTLDLLVDIENPENQLRKILKNEDFLLAVDFGGEEAKELKFDPGRRDYFEVFRGVKPLEAFNRMLEEYDRYKQNVLDLDDTQRFKDIYMFIRGFIAQYRRHYGITKDILFATYKTTGLSSSWKPLGNLENPVTILNTTSWDLLSPNFLDFSISAESKYKINFVGASGLIDIEADPWREAKLRDKKIYLLRTPSRGGIKNIVGETIAGKITEDKGGIEGAEGSIIPASGILARMESGYAILFDHTPEYSEIEDYLDIIVSLEEAKEFTPLSFSSISKGNKGLVIPGDLKLPVEESPYEFVVSSFETEKEHLDRGKRIIDAREREGVIVLTKDKPEAFMSEGDVVYVRETEDSMDSRLSYTLKDGEFAATGIILSNRKYREEAQTHFDSLKGNIEIRNEEDLIRLRIAQKKKEDINNFMKYLDYLKKNPDKRKIEKIPENEREKEKYFKNKNLEILGIDKLPPDKKEAKAVLSRAKKRLLKIYYDVTGRDEYLGRIATRINGAADYLGDMIEKRESEGDADSGNDQQDNGGGLIGKLFNFDGELLVSGFDVKLDAARGQVRMNHYDKSGEKDMKEVSLTLADDMKNFSSEDLTNILSTWLLSTRNPLMKKKPRDRILKQARNLIKSMGKIKSVKVIEENPEVRGYLSDDGVLYLSRYLAENPMALLHELGEKYAVLPEGYPDLSRHTYMRGAGKDLRRAYSALVKEKGVRAVNSLDLNDFISAIEKKMDELGMRSERKGQGQSLITASEKDLMRYNYDNRGAYYDVKERNKLLFYGFQDNLDPARNTVFTSEIKELNQNLKGGLNIVLVRTSNPATASRITELSRKMSRKYKKNKLNTEVLCYHDADSLKKQMEKAYEIALKNRELWPKISVDCNMPGDLGAAKEFIENISAQDDRKMFITLKDFLPGNPDEHMIAINKIIPVAALLSGIKRRQDDFKEKPEEIAFLIRERMLFLRNSGFFSEIEGSRIDFEKMSDSELLEFTDQLVTGEILVTITQIDLEEIPRWYETQKAIESSV